MKRYFWNFFILTVLLAAVTSIVFFNQLIYGGSVVLEIISDRLSHCVTSESEANVSEIVYEFDCSSLAYLNDLVIYEGNDAVLNLFGKGQLEIKISKINNNLENKRTVKLKFFNSFGQSRSHLIQR